MKSTRAKALGWLMILIGVSVVALSKTIVFPGLERIVGIETIVGRENVVYQPDGGYVFTNPGAMIRWVLSVGAIGVLVCASGLALVFSARRSKH